MAIRIQLRRDTAANWTSANPTLRAGEVGIETDTLKFKIGNGTQTWTQITTYANVTPSSLTSSLSDYILAADQGTPGGPAELDSNGDLIIPENSIVLWNKAEYDYITTLTATQPTADRTITLPNATGTMALTSNIPSTTDNLSEGSTNKYFTDERAQDAVSTALAAGTHTNITVTYSDEANSISLAAAPGYVDEQAVDAVATALAAGTHTNISVSYNDNANSISLTGATTYSDENAQDAIGNSLGTGLSYNDTTGAISVNTTTIQARVANVTDTEIGYLDGVTSAIQTQIDSKAASASPTFTGTATLGGTGDFVINGTSNIRITPAAGSNAYVGTASADNIIATAAGLNLKAPLASPTFTGTVTLPSGTVTSTMILDGTIANADINASAAIDWTKLGISSTVSSTEIGYVDGVTSAIQTQLDAKAPLASPTFTGTVAAADLTLSGNLTVNGTTTNLNSTNLVIEDKNIVLGDTETPTDTTADGGGITLKGATDKTLNWVDATDAWTSSEDFNLLTGKVYEINGTSVLSSTTLGSGITGSSLTSVGTIATGVWNGTAIAIANGGTGSTTASTAAAALLPAQTSNSGKYLTTDGSGTLSWGTVSGYSAPTIGSTSIASGATVTTIAGLTLTSPTITGTPTISGTGDFLISGDTNVRIVPASGSNAYVGAQSAGNIIVTAGGTQTLTNKTLTSPVISTITNTGTLTLPTTTGTLALTSQLVASAAPATEGKLFGSSSSTASSKTTVGYQAGNASSSNIVAVGYQAGLLSTAASNTSVGYQAFAAGTTAAESTAIGFQALNSVQTSSGHTAVGYQALKATLNASGNTAVGTYSFMSAISGSNNTGLGNAAGYAVTTGTENTAIGCNALAASTTASNNTGLGSFALRFATGANNTAVGQWTGYEITTGTNNTLIGRQAGKTGSNDLTTGSNNIIIGANTGASSATVSNEITLGNASVTTFRIPGLSISATTTALTVPSLTPTNAIAAIYGGTGFSTYATGDIIYSSATNTLAKLAAGTNGQILTLASGVPSWAAAPAGFSAPTIGSTSIASGATVTSISGLTLKETSSTTISANTATTIDTNALSAFTTAKYVISIKQGSKVRSSEVIVQTDGTSVDMTEFGITETGGAISGIVVSAAVSSTDCVLQVTITDAATTNATVKINKVLI